MLDLEKVKKYAFSQGTVSVPEIQRMFKLSYSKAREAVDKLVEEGYLRFDGGIEYFYVKDNEGQATEPTENGSEMEDISESDKWTLKFINVGMRYFALPSLVKDVLIDLYKRDSTILQNAAIRKIYNEIKSDADEAQMSASKEAADFLQTFDETEYEIFVSRIMVRY